MWKWSKLTVFSVTATAETALNKLKKAQIPVKNCKKRGAEFIFNVNSEYSKKVFAIFEKPCYNIRIKRDSIQNRAFRFMRLRAGLIAGVILFIAVCALSDSYVLKISVGGSGAYLESAVRQIAYSSGFKEFSRYSNGDGCLASARILSLPNVTFCSISKSGSVLYIDVQTSRDGARNDNGGGLDSDARGTVSTIVALCGTALVSEGDEVSRGDPLIGAYSVVDGQNVPCLAVGYCDIICSAETVYAADCESVENLTLALASCLSVSENILTREYAVRATADGVNYIINFTYMHTISINLQ